MRKPRRLLPIPVLAVSACGPDPAEQEKLAIVALQTQVPALQKSEPSQ
jgi:hypothetical protein